MRTYINIINEALASYAHDDDWSLSDIPYLYHGTSSKHLPGILSMGLSAPNHWGSLQVAEFFAKGTCRDTGGKPVFIRIPARGFAQQHFSIDEEMVDFPIFDDYDRRAMVWQDIADPTWEDSLRVYEAIVYGVTVGVDPSEVFQQSGAPYSRKRPVPRNVPQTSPKDRDTGTD